MNEQIRDLRCITLYGKHFVDLEKEHKYYLDQISELEEKRDKFCSKLISMDDASIQFSNESAVMWGKTLVVFFSVLFFSIYNTTIFNVQITPSNQFILLTLNIPCLIISMLFYNKQNDNVPDYLDIYCKFQKYSDDEHKSLKDEFEQIEEEIEIAKMEYEDLNRKIKKLQ